MTKLILSKLLDAPSFLQGFSHHGLPFWTKLMDFLNLGLLLILMGHINNPDGGSSDPAGDSWDPARDSSHLKFLKFCFPRFFHLCKFGNVDLMNIVKRWYDFDFEMAVFLAIFPQINVVNDVARIFRSFLHKNFLSA